MKSASSLIANKYRLLGRLNEGSFGTIYNAVNVITQENIILKIESIKEETKLLKNETKIYQYLWNDLSTKEGIPKIYWFGISGNYYCMAIELLGPSLLSAHVEIDKDYSQIRLIGIQMFKRLQFVHSKNIIHRDVKPDNFLLKEDMIYIIDFGFSRLFKRNGSHISEKNDKRENIIGTPNYVSIRVLEGGEPSRRDDLESVVYIMYYLLKKTISIEDKYTFLEENRDKYSIPTFLIECFDFCRKLRFDENPNYELLFNILSIS